MIRLIATLALVLPAYLSMSQFSFSLEEAIAYSMENAAQIKLEKKDIEDAEWEILEYKSIGIPKIYGNLDYTYNLAIPVVQFPDVVTNSTYQILFDEGLLEPRPLPPPATAPVQIGTTNALDAGISMNTLLFDFSWIQGLKAQKMLRDLVIRELNVTEYQTRSTITRAYMAVLIMERTVGLIDNNISNIQKILAETQALYETGFAEKLDADRLQLSLDNLRVEKQRVLGNVIMSENMLKFQMGFPVEEDIDLTDDFDLVASQVDVEANDLTATLDYFSRPEYLALSLLEELNDVNVQVIKAGYMPSFSGKAYYGQSLQRNDLFDKASSPWFASSYVGVSMSLPIFDGLERRSKIKQAEISSDMAEIRRIDFENAMEMEVRNARIDFINAREIASSRVNAMDLAQSIYNTTQIKYREGVGSSVELTQAETELYTSQRNYIDALYALIVAKTDLDIALGKM